MIDRIIGTPWHFMRWLRLIAGLFFGIGAVVNYDLPVLLSSILLIVQAVFNWGCCGVSSCNTPIVKKQTTPSTQEIDFEEVK